MLLCFPGGDTVVVFPLLPCYYYSALSCIFHLTTFNKLEIRNTAFSVWKNLTLFFVVSDHARTSHYRTLSSTRSVFVYDQFKKNGLRFYETDHDLMGVTVWAQVPDNCAIMGIVYLCLYQSQPPNSTSLCFS